MAKELIVEIDENGKMVYQTVGFKGKSCLAFGQKFTKFLKRFGIDLSDEKIDHTGEYHETEQCIGVGNRENCL